MKLENQREAREGLQHCLDALDDMKVSWKFTIFLIIITTTKLADLGRLAQLGTGTAVASRNRSR